MLLGVQFSIDAAILLIALILQPVVMHRLFPQSQHATSRYRWAANLSGIVLVAGFVSNVLSSYGLDASYSVWIRGIALTWAIAIAAAAMIGMIVAPPGRRPSLERRRFLGLAARAGIAAPVAGVGFGMFIERERFGISEVAVPFPGLPKDLDGLRIVQLTDVHLGPFLSEKTFARAIDMANETKPHIAVVTGDLISDRSDPIDAAIRQVARLRSDAGILGCHGNHEIYAGMLNHATEECARRGIQILRMRNARLQFGTTFLNFAGVDYQPMRSVYLPGAEKLVRPGEMNILLSHNPDVFPVAAAKGFGLTLSGHTHGGQINFEILDSNINMAHFFTPYTRGLYREKQSAVYVSSGIGTIGVPVRFGARPEVSLIRLCAI